MSIYFFYGDEDYNIELEINKLKKKLLDKNFSSMNFKQYDNPNVPDLLSILRTQPMMFGNQVVVINCQTYFKKEFDDSQIKEIANALEDNTESLCVIFTAVYPRNEGSKPDARKKIYKTITKYAQVQEFPTIKVYYTDEILNFINKTAKKLEITLEKDAALTLIEYIGNNLRELANELEKLKLLAYPETKINKKMVKEICVSSEDLFAFADFILDGNTAMALREFRKLLEKKQPMELLAPLQTMLKKWIMIKINSNKSTFDIAKIVGQNEFVVKKTLQKMKDLPVKNLVKLKENLTNAEFNIKNGTATEPVSELEIALFR